MNPEVKQQWLAALRSGYYMQNVGQLWGPVNGKPTFCALGVLCEVCDSTQRIPYGYRATGQRSWFKALMEDTGLTWDALGEVIDMNEARQSFAKIADWVEANA